MKGKIIVGLVAVLAGGQATMGTQPVVVNHYAPGDLSFVVEEVFPHAYVDIPGSAKVVTIPAGMAFITWSFRPYATGDCRVRPVIGENHEEYGLWARGTAIDGSWITATNGGTIEVKLQAELHSSNDMIGDDVNTSLSWTLIVFPDEETVPTVSGSALIGMVAVNLPPAMVAGTPLTSTLPYGGQSPVTVIWRAPSRTCPWW